MAKIMARFVNGCAEVLGEIDVERPEDPPMWYSLCPPTADQAAGAESEPLDGWEAVYVRQDAPEAGAPWTYRFQGLADPEG